MLKRSWLFGSSAIVAAWAAPVATTPAATADAIHLRKKRKCVLLCDRPRSAAAVEENATRRLTVIANRRYLGRLTHPLNLVIAVAVPLTMARTTLLPIVLLVVVAPATAVATPRPVLMTPKD